MHCHKRFWRHLNGRPETVHVFTGQFPDFPGFIAQRFGLQNGQGPPQAKGEQFGRALGHFVLGQRAVAIVVKATSRIDSADRRPFKAFVER